MTSAYSLIVDMLRKINTDIGELTTTVDEINSSVDTGFDLTGDAAVGNVLATKTFYNTSAETQLTGTMPNIGAGNKEVTTLAGTTIAEGYYTGAGKAILSAAEIAKVIVGNIKTGITILGVTGTYDTEAGNPIAVGTVLNTKVGFVNGTKITGTMPNKSGNPVVCTSSAVDGTTLKLLVPAGYYDGATYVTITDADFVEANIVSPVNIFGLAGTHGA